VERTREGRRWGYLPEWFRGPESFWTAQCDNDIPMRGKLSGIPAYPFNPQHRVEQNSPRRSRIALTYPTPLKQRHDANEDPHVLTTRYTHHPPLGTSFDQLIPIFRTYSN